ncbi:MAG: hypothetical protein JW993_05790 [Sedimentisphaerales bacterium]|nr:hypothetical protein [Sedimentisphaerales bacterium]
MKDAKWMPVLLCFLFHATAHADWWDDLVAEAQVHVVRTQECVFNQDIAIELKKGQALELKCAPNVHAIARFIVYYYYDTTITGTTEPVIRCDAWFETGATSGGGSRVSSDGAMRQAGDTDCVAITRWRVVGDHIQVQFRASDDIEFIHERYRTWTAQGLRFSKSFGDRRFVPAIELSETERLAGFARLWSEVRYNFAFFDQVPEVDWDRILIEYIPQVQAAKADVAYYKVLQRCIALLRDGHTGVWGPSDEPSYELPIRVEAVQNQAVVVQVCPIEGIPEHRLQAQLRTADVRIGDIVTHVDGRPVPEILSADIYPYISASTHQGLDRQAYPRLLKGENGSMVRLGITRLDGSRDEVTLTCARYPYPRQSNEFACRTLTGDVVYVNLNSFGSDQVVKDFDAAYECVMAAQGLILDVRRNGGGSSSHGYAILSRLIDKDVPASHWRSPRHVAAHKAWGREEQWQEGDHGTIRPHETMHYSGPVVVLAGPDTASAAEDFVVAFQTSRRGHVIGQKTNGSTGQPLVIELPGGGEARICTKRDTYPDGREFVGIGCIPDIEIGPTRQDVASGRDIVLEKAVEWLHAQRN